MNCEIKTITASIDNGIKIMEKRQQITKTVGKDMVTAKKLNE